MIKLTYLNKKSPLQCVVQILDIKLYYYDETVVAFEHPTTGLKVSRNVWDKKATKFLDTLLSEEERIDNASFRRTLNQLLGTLRAE